MSNLLTVKEVAARLNLTPVRVRMLIKAGRLPAQKVGRDWLITERALNAFSPRPVGRPRKEK